MRNESLGACPVCSATARTVLHADLADDTFRAVPGTWTLWRCAGCAAAYLDPRPDRATIAEAYQSYYTHGTVPALRLSWRGRIRERMENGYLHAQYGADRQPRSAFGGLLYRLLLPYKHMSDVAWRHLPGPGRGRRLLDVGCGNGSFLAQARTCGWSVEGVDPDAAAAAEATRRGMPVRVGGLELYAGQAACFDLITLSHVIEHVHDPMATLADCHRLLKPGGRLWIATPNIDSDGHAFFGRHWRGLEAPRHLVLFNEPVLRQALHRAGFTASHRLPSQMLEPLAIARASHAMAQGKLPLDATVRLPARLRWAAWRMAACAWLQPTRSEFLFITAVR